ncbi:MAG: hypothetical protein WDL87_00060 [Candidatus Omnitrophota bacterium]|jgi:hypothetical protein
MKLKIDRLLLILVIMMLASFLLYRQRMLPVFYVSPYPDGLNFAFTVTDDPDGAKLEKVKVVYDTLDKLGFKTTIACWVFKPKDLEAMPDQMEQQESATLEDAAYLKFIKYFQKKGFEIALHTVTSGHDTSDVTRRGYERFKEVIGCYPKINIMHSKNKENIYWGRNISSNALWRYLVSMYSKIDFSGEDRKSPYFWGDICREKTKYLRLWGTSQINTLKFNPSMPYHEQEKPYVNYWFSFSDGYNGIFFSKLLTKKNVNKLVRERGSCIVYTHFAAGFCEKINDDNYVLRRDIEEILEDLASRKEGWFVPTSDLLDRLEQVKNISISSTSDGIIVTNHNPGVVKGLTVVTKQNLKYTDEKHKLHQANEEGEIVLGDVLSKESKVLNFGRLMKVKVPCRSLGSIEKLRLVIERLRIMAFEHRG